MIVLLDTYLRLTIRVSRNFSSTRQRSYPPNGNALLLHPLFSDGSQAHRCQPEQLQKNTTFIFPFVAAAWKQNTSTRSPISASKKSSGEEASKPLLIDFLSALLPRPDKIVDLRFKNTEQLGRTHPERKAVYDIYCENERGESSSLNCKKPSRIIKPL